MADRAAARLAIDLGFAAAVLACGIATYVLSGTPSVPEGVCRLDTGSPRYPALLADGRITIAAVFGELKGGPGDRNAWSYQALTVALRERGFVEVTPARFERGDLAIDLQLLPDDPVRLTAALTAALADHDLVYYNGHNEGGALDVRVPDDYRVIVMDTCFSTQLYSARLAGANRDVIGNRQRSITGSVQSLLVLVDGLGERVTWHTMLAEMNRFSDERARMRGPITRFKDAEDYRIDVICPHH